MLVYITQKAFITSLLLSLRHFGRTTELKHKKLDLRVKAKKNGGASFGTNSGYINLKNNEALNILRNFKIKLISFPKSNSIILE